jgi:glycosyltransferase involved in cell wall biosynthesis
MPASTPQQVRDPIPPVPAGLERPLWSVMIPTYNCAGYLGETLASVLAQDPGPERMQIEVVDDGSSDDPEAVVEELGGGRVGFFRQPENVGHVANFTTCLSRARGHLVHLLHGDDAVRDGFYATMAPHFEEHPETGAAFCRHVYVDEDGHWLAIARLHQGEPGPFEQAADRILTLLPIQTPTMVVRREVYERLGGFDRRVPYGEDLEMWVRIAGSFPIRYEPAPLALYRGRSGSNSATSMQTGQNLRDALRAIDLALDSLPPERRADVRRASRARCAGWALDSAAMLVEAGNRRGAVAQLREALRASPSVTTVAHLGGIVSGRVVEREPRIEPPRLAPDAIRTAGRRRPPIEPVPAGTDRPTWSVMIPTYQQAEYLRETLASVLAQDPGPERMQIEVVDDASSDGPAEVVTELGGGRVALHRQPGNVGHAENFNTCLRRARGRLVHLLHGDDCVREGFYETMERLLDAHPEAGAGFCRYLAMDEEGRWHTVSPLEQREPGVMPDFLARIATGQRTQTHCMVVRREVYEAVGGFDGRLEAEDWEMWVRVAAHSPVAHDPAPLALYRVHRASRSHELLRSGANAGDLRQVVAINRELFTPESADRVARAASREIATACVRRARRLLGSGEVDAMWAQLREAVRSDPSPPVLAGATMVAAGRLAVGLGLLRTDAAEG